MRIFFAGTPDIAVPTLEALSQNYEVVGVLTNPDKRTGRGRKLAFSPVKEKALELGLPLFQPEKLDRNFYDLVASLKADILVCLAFGKIFRKSFLEIFPEGGINLHPSRLPEWRGPSPLSAAILSGQKETAISVQRLALKMDSGNILMQRSLPLNGRETTGDLTAIAAKEGADMVVSVLGQIKNKQLNERPQDEEKVTFCHLIKKEDSVIDWNKSAIEIDSEIRAYNPWPLSFSFFNGVKLNIIETEFSEENTQTPPGSVLSLDKKRGILVQTGEGLLIVKKLQLQSRKVLDYSSFINGVKDFVGSKLGEET